jgi:uncharacterized lipoprotein YddW (UPF0748 family)
MKQIFTMLFICLFFITAQAQNPKQEFRGAWIATVGNIDYPSSKTLTTAQQQAEFIKLLDQHKLAGINAVMVQIRTNGDAFYPSELAPWSEFLTGRQGKAPEPFYDPMLFMISECRKRGIEFHAWFNPYRAIANVNTAILDAKHVAIKHPEWLLPFGNLRVLDPGNPEVRKHVTQVVLEVTNRYDVDGIHFDDYFYPYPTTGLTLNDSATYANNKRGIVNKNDWRRDNVNLLVKMISDSIKSVKPWVKFGISPFGIWQNKTTAQPLGSATGGLESYNDIYCDTRTWLQKGWIDYIAPQLYWNIGKTAADFAILVPWWANNVFDRHFYIGHAAYQINTPNVNVADGLAWQNSSQMPNQIRLVRNTANAQGSMFYNTNTLNKNPLGFRDSLITKLYNTPSLMPTMAWKDAVAPNVPQNLSVNLTNTGLELKWTKPTAGTSELEKIRGYVIYRFANNETVDINKANAIRTIIYKDTTAFFDTQSTPQATKYTYVITAFDRLNNESQPSNASTAVLVTGIEEENLLTELSQNAPNPFSDFTVIKYRLAKSGNVLLTIKDLFGQDKVILVNEKQSAGNQSVEFRNQTLNSGIYVYVLETEDGFMSRKMVVVR